MTTAINKVARILKKVSSSEKFPDSSTPELKKVPFPLIFLISPITSQLSASSLQAYKPMAKLRRESSLPRIEVDRPRPLIRTASDPICYGSTNFPSVQGVVLQNENYLESPNDKSQKLLTNTKKVRGLRSFLWIKSSANSAQASFVSQVNGRPL